MIPIPESKKVALPRHMEIGRSLASGAVAGAIAKSTIAPLDRTKILFQVSKEQFTYRAAYKLLRNNYLQDGITSLWRGNSATMARIIPYAAIQFTAHDQLKKKLGSIDGKPLPPLRRLVAGSSAGVTAAFITYPLDLVRARLAVARKLKYAGLMHTFKTIRAEEGMRAFYNGFIPTVCGIVPYAGISFFTYESLKSYHDTRTEGRDPTAIERLLYGAVAGLFGQSFSYPFDIVRRRMQTDGLDGGGYKYRNLLYTLRHVLDTEGVIKGYYKGISINWIKSPIAIGLSFMTYDMMQKLFSYFGDDAYTQS